VDNDEDDGHDEDLDETVVEDVDDAFGIHDGKINGDERTMPFGRRW
jgi:hypothetical protein